MPVTGLQLLLRGIPYLARQAGLEMGSPERRTALDTERGRRLIENILGRGTIPTAEATTVSPSALSDIQRDYFQANPEAAFRFIFQPFLQGGRYEGWVPPAFRSFLSGQMGDYLGKYKMAAAAQPQLTLLDFLQEQNPFGEYEALMPSQRGERPERFAPRIQRRRLFGF